MNEINQLQKKQNQTLILVIINFLLFMVLFAGLGYVAWQSAVLVNRLQADLERAEEAIAGMQARFRNMDMDALADNLTASASERIDQSLGNAIQEADLSGPLARATDKMEATQAMIENTGQTLKGVHDALKGIDNEEIARLVAYHILKGLGDGFQQAAEARNPAAIPQAGSDSDTPQ